MKLRHLLFGCALVWNSACAKPEQSNVSNADSQNKPVAVVDASSGSKTKPIYALGDVHGDLDHTVQALKMLGLVTESSDKQVHWSGGDAILVQTGDILDRGPAGHSAVLFFERLAQEAKTAGGQVVNLLGNHEIMNLSGDWRYVSQGDLAEFGSVEARIKAFSPGGYEFGWLTERDLTTKVGNTLFVHAGILPEFASLGLDEINQRARKALMSGPEAVQREQILHNRGVVWDRTYAEKGESEMCLALSEALTTLRACRMVVGHTPQRSGKITSKCGGKLLLIDVGLSQHYGGNVAALELKDGTDAWAVYPSGREDLPDNQNCHF